MAKIVPGEAEPKDPLQESIDGLKSIVLGEVAYEHTELTRTYSEVSMLADQALAEQALSPLEAIELKLSATKDARTAAHSNGDFEFASSLTQTVAVLENIQATLRVPAVASTKEPASTVASRTSGAKA